jgi:hypothetical protein
MTIGRLRTHLAFSALTVALMQVATADSQAPLVYTTRPNLDAIQGQPSQTDQALFVGANRPIIHKSGAQSETTIAVDPTDSRHLLASSNDLSNFSTFNNVRESFDGGRTWADAGVFVNTFCYDPWLTFNANGDAFFAYECSDQRIAYKLAGTNNWVHRTLQNSSLFPDRDMVVADTHPGSPFFHSVYVGYDEAAQNNAAHVWYSRDGINNWATGRRARRSTTPARPSASTSRAARTVRSMPSGRTGPLAGSTWTAPPTAARPGARTTS